MQLMYRPPRADKHEKISDTLDRLHSDIEHMTDKINAKESSSS